MSQTVHVFFPKISCVYLKTHEMNMDIGIAEKHQSSPLLFPTKKTISGPSPGFHADVGTVFLHPKFGLSS